MAIVQNQARSLPARNDRRQAIALAGGYDTMRFRSRDPFLDPQIFALIP